LLSRAARGYSQEMLILQGGFDITVGKITVPHLSAFAPVRRVGTARADVRSDCHSRHYVQRREARAVHTRRRVRQAQVSSGFTTFYCYGASALPTVSYARVIAPLLYCAHLARGGRSSCAERWNLAPAEETCWGDSREVWRLFTTNYAFELNLELSSIFGFLLGFSVASGFAAFRLLDEYKQASAALQLSVEELQRNTERVRSCYRGQRRILNISLCRYRLM